MGMTAAPYVVDVVRREAETAGVPVMNGGFQITTTIDARLQTLASDALAAGLTRAEARAGYKHPKFATRAAGSIDYLQGAVVAIDPEDGAVLAMVGGRSYADSHFNRALNALRQPGSAFKPIVYAAAIADTLTAGSIVFDTALTIPLDRNSIYRPRNDDGQFLGPMTLRDALVRLHEIHETHGSVDAEHVIVDENGGVVLAFTATPDATATADLDRLGLARLT